MKTLVAVLVVVLLGVAGVVLLRSDGDDRREGESPSTRAAVVIKPITTARAVVRVRGLRTAYVMDGHLDLRDGYRFLASVTGGFAGAQPSTLWLGGAHSTYDALIRQRLGRGRSLWLNDHPPTLPMARGFNQVGAEAYAHLAMLALTHADPRQPRFDAARRVPLVR